MAKSNEPRILTFDVETLGVGALHADQGIIVTLCYKWSDDSRVYDITVSEKELLNLDDRSVLERAIPIFEKADILVGHFAAVFDRRHINGRLLAHGLDPLPNQKIRDTCLIARSVANYKSNSLDNLGRVLNLKNKKNNRGLRFPESWMALLRGDLSVLTQMVDYCKQDVRATEELYFKLRPFDNAHPRIITDRSKCQVCEGDVEYRGVVWVNSKQYRRYVCKECHRWGRETKCIKVEKEKA
jgi:uncharacterized protein YprB with RNaseH-like and TPR domain